MGEAFLEEDFFAIVLRALVDGADEFDGFTGFGGAGGGLAALGDRLDHFFEIALMLVGINRGGIVSAQAGFLAFHEGGFDLGVLGFFVFKIPDLERFVGEEDGALGAGELDAGGVAVLRPSAGGGFNDAAGAALEFEEGDAVVLHFDTLMREAGGSGLN